MYKLYQMQDSGNCYKIRLLLSQLKVPFELVDIDILKGESRSKEFLTMNPNGRVPLLQLDANTWLPESNAILWYLARDTSYLPSDPLSQARVLQWMFFEQYSHEPFIATSRFWISILKQPKEYARQIEERRAGGIAALELMDRELASRAFIAGEHYSIADIALYAYTHVAGEGGFDLSRYLSVGEWLERVRLTPGFVAMEAR